MPRALFLLKYFLNYESKITHYGKVIFTSALLVYVSGPACAGQQDCGYHHPQKLELRKANIGWVDHPTYFAKKTDEDDSMHSVVYLGPPRKDSIDLNLPPMQATRVSLRATMHRPLPLFRIQQ